MSLGKKTLQGAAWAYGSFIGGRLVNLITTSILARVLFPEDFGLIGFGLIVYNFIEAARGLGINDALIYNTERVDDAANSAFLMNVGLGITQYALAFLFAPLAVNFIDDPRIVDLIRIMALPFIFIGFTQTHDAQLQKDLKFNRRIIPDIASTITKGVVSIGLALAGFGVWSLAIGLVAGAIVTMILTWVVLPWRPNFRFYPDKARELWRYGMHILLLNALSIVITQANGAIIGSLLGAAELGYYTIASRLPDILVINFSLVLTRIIFPAYVKMKEDREQLKRGFLKTTQYTSFITVAAGMGLVAVAPEMVKVVFVEDRWLPAIPLFRVIALIGMVSTLAWNAGDVLKAIGRPDVITKLLVVETTYTVILIYVFASTTGLAVMASTAMLIAYSINAVVRLYIISRFLDLSFWQIVSIFRSPFTAGTVMLVAVATWSNMLRDTQSPLLVLVTSIILGAIVYTSIMFILERDEFRKLQTAVRGFLRPSHNYT